MTMRAALLLLYLSIPCASGRLGTRIYRETQENVHFSANETQFLAKNKIPFFYSNQDHTSDSVQLDSAPFALESQFDNVTLKLLPPDEPAILLDEHVGNATVQNHRELQRSVTVVNRCSSQSFWLAIIYYDTRDELVHKGWYNIPAGRSIIFQDVGRNQYSLYAISKDLKFRWGGSPSTSTYCPSGRCYRDFQIGNGNAFSYLSCNDDQGPSPTPAPPVPSPTPGPSISARAQLWVNAHNTRREPIHKSFGKSYVPLKWNNALANSAQTYAERLASVTTQTCFIEHGYQGDSFGGENIAANWGTRSPTFESPERVLYRWFEEEANDDWPANGHRTQVAWRGTSQVGCGEAKKLYDGEFYCMIQVCRYLAPGNCNIGTKSLRALMADDSSPCGPQPIS